MEMSRRRQGEGPPTPSALLPRCLPVKTGIEPKSEAVSCSHNCFLFDDGLFVDEGVGGVVSDRGPSCA